MKEEYDFYSCHRCRRLITLPQIQKRLEHGGSCSCGSLKMSPSNMSWYHWLKPSVWQFAWLRYRGAA